MGAARILFPDQIPGFVSGWPDQQAPVGTENQDWLSQRYAIPHLHTLILSVALKVNTQILRVLATSVSPGIFSSLSPLLHTSVEEEERNLFPLPILSLLVSGEGHRECS